MMLQESTSHDEGAVYDRLSASLQGLPTEEAIRRVKEFLATFPSFALAHNDLGVLYHQAGNPTLALAHHEKASRLQPDNILFRKNLADFYAVELGWIEDAVDIYLEVVRRNPRDTEALIALGQLGAALAGNRTLPAPAARPQLEVMPAMSPAPPATPYQPPAPPVMSDQELYQQVQEALRSNDAAEAADLLRRLTERDPDNAQYHNDLGVVRYQSGDIPGAKVCYEQAVALAPDNALYVRNLADLYFVELNQADDAIRLYLELHRKNPRDVETLTSLGHISAAVARPDEAKIFYRRALEIEPWNKEAREALANLQQSPQLQTLKPETSTPQPAKNPEQLVAEARVLMEQGQADGARRLLEQAIALNPRLAVAHNDLGVAAYRLGDLGAAQVAYEQAVKLEPDNLNFTMNLADLYFVAAGRPDDAIHMYLDLFRQFPRNIEVLTALGSICQAVGRPDEAKTFYRRVLEIEPWNESIRTLLKSQG